jgi:DNA-binding GntR family transcriptional regulator
MGMSYTPVREAIIQLTGEGLLERNPDGAVALKKLTREELEDIYDLRIALESRAAELAARRIRPAQVRQLRQALRTFVRYARDVKMHGYTREQAEIHLDATPKTDMTFHLLLMQASGSRQILKIVSDMHVLSHAHRQRVALHEGESFAQRCVGDCLSHWRVFRAIEAHDAPRAFAQMRRHLEDAKQYHLDTFDRLQESRRQRESQIGEWSDEVLSLLSEMEDGAATNQEGNSPAV